MSQITLNKGRGREKMRESIQDFENLLLCCKQVDIKLDHHFSDGIYMRKVLIPKGAYVTGEIHKTQHINVIPSGKIICVTEEGSKMIVGPHMMMSYPDTKRAAYALEDTIWVTIHENKDNIKDLDILKRKLIKQPNEVKK